MFSHCLAPTGSSLAENERILLPIHALSYWCYPNKTEVFCQGFPGEILYNLSKKQKHQPRSISSALRSVVSVMLVPPMILASSRFLPSRSSGVTVV